MTASGRPVILFDCDNTLLDNDEVQRQLAETLRKELGVGPAEHFWEIYDDVRTELDFVDFPATIQRFRHDYPDHPAISHLREFVFRFPFREVVYTGTRAAVFHARTLGTPVILSDGDQVFQRHKIRAAGLEALFEGRVLVYIHKEFSMADVEALYPANHYVMVDDKPRIHAGLKRLMKDRITTVQVRQGKYAHDRQTYTPPPDRTIEDIFAFTALREGDLVPQVPTRGLRFPGGQNMYRFRG